MNWMLAVWDMLAESGAWLLVGFFIAGILRLLLSREFVQTHLSGGGIKSILKATAIGVPLPLCSCSVIPVAVSLRERGASRGATASFLISTPEIGVDSFLLSSGLLGIPITLFRIVAASFSALAVGLMIDRTETAAEKALHEKSKLEREGDKTLEQKRSFREALRFGYIELVDDIAVSLTIGFFAAGLITAIVPLNYFSDLHVSYPILLLLMLFISLPTYVCATSSTPLAAALLSRGMAPGAVLVFLLAGPATNLATMLVVRQQLGSKALAIYLGGIAAVALGFAFLADAVLGDVLPTATASAHVHGGMTAGTVGGLMLAGLLIWRLSAKALKRGAPIASQKKDCHHC